MPVLVAPTAFHRMAHPDGEAGTARAAAAVGTIMCLSTIATSTPAEVAAAAPGRAALVPALRVPRPGRHERARRPGGRGGLRGDRAHGRRAAPRSPRARSPHRVPACPRTCSFRASPPRRAAGTARRRSRCSAWIDPTLTWRDLERARGRLAAAGDRQGDPDRRGRARSPASTALRRSSSRTTAAASSTASRRRRAAARGGRGGRRAARGARRRRDPPRHATWSRRSRSVPGRCSSAVPSSGVSPTAASRARAACSSCSATRPSSRSRSVAAPHRRRSPRRTSVESAARER